MRSDRNELVYAMQLSNNVDYQGYDLWTQTGFRVWWIDRASAEKATTETTLFVTVFAGIRVGGNREEPSHTDALGRCSS